MDDLELLATRVENEKAEKSKIEGRIESLMESLEDEGYSTTKEAKTDMIKIKIKIKSMKKTLSEKVTLFKRKYRNELMDL